MGTPTPGLYDFTNFKNADGGKFNFAVDFGLNMSPNYLYFFHQLNFSMSIEEGAYLNAIEPDTVPILKVKDSSSNTPLIHYPLRMFRFFESTAIDCFYKNANTNARITGEFQCRLQDTADLVGLDDIYAQVSISVYEITDNDYIAKYSKMNI
jgi:hypothetical protein